MRHHRWLRTSLVVAAVFWAGVAGAADIDWGRLKTLEGDAFLQYVRSLDLKNHQALDFWKKIPVSTANKQVFRIFKKEAFAIYMNKYPRPKGEGFQFRVGMGTDITGQMSGRAMKLPFTGYLPLAKGLVGRPDKTYRIGYTIHGFDHPWLVSNADSAIWEAGLHPNVKLTVLDPRFDNTAQVRHIDDWVKQGLDGILVWPMQEAPMGPPVQRAVDAGIPCVSVDRMVGTRSVSARITGNFPANGAQQGMYLVHRLLRESGRVEGNIVMIRKPLGSTADSMRTGHFLKVISYFPGLKILGSFHNPSNRKDSRVQVAATLKKFEDLDIVFCTGAEQGMGAVKAIEAAGRWESRKQGRRIIVLSNDDLSEALDAVETGKMAMTAPYTPMLGALGLRTLIRIINGDPVPRDVITPDLFMITREGETVFGINTVSVQDWRPYAYGKAD